MTCARINVAYGFFARSLVRSLALFAINCCFGRTQYVRQSDRIHLFIDDRIANDAEIEFCFPQEIPFGFNSVTRAMFSSSCVECRCTWAALKVIDRSSPVNYDSYMNLYWTLNIYETRALRAPLHDDINNAQVQNAFECAGNRNEIALTCYARNRRRLNGAKCIACEFLMLFRWWTRNSSKMRLKESPSMSDHIREREIVYKRSRGRKTA